MTSEEFVRNAAALIGRPYSEVDCIGVVRLAAKIRCQGTNWLWRSYHNSGKYKYLDYRLDRPPAASELRNGLLVFRIKWNERPKGYNDTPNCHHVGIIDGADVIQSQESKGVYRKKYNPDEWQACGWLKQITRVEIPLDPDPNDDEPFSDIDIDSDISGSEDIIDPLFEIYHMVKAIYDKIIID